MAALSKSLGLAQPDESEDPQVALHQLLSDNEDLEWVRARTARNATRLSELAGGVLAGRPTQEIQERAMAGLLAAGSFARPMALPDTPPILSMRIHAFFRGVPGFWACLNPNCPEVPTEFQGERPVGRIYTDPRPVVLGALWRQGLGVVLVPQVRTALLGRDSRQRQGQPVALERRLQWRAQGHHRLPDIRRRTAP